MKVLNLYSGIGGNRKLWTDVEVTAVELNPEIAKIYQDFFPEDKVIVADAHQYLLDHFKEFDFIWSSPPCPTHSRIRQNTAVARGQNDPVYIDMKLYQEIIFLKYNFGGDWIVENVIPYYKPLIPPSVELHRHIFWSNYYIPNTKVVDDRTHNAIKVNSSVYGFNLSNYNVPNRVMMLRNMVNPEVANYILNCAKDYTEPIQEGLFQQTEKV